MSLCFVVHFCGCRFKGIGTNCFMDQMENLSEATELIKVSTWNYEKQCQLLLNLNFLDLIWFEAPFM